MLELSILLIGTVVTVGMGAPLVARIARAPLLSRHAPAAPRPDRTDLQHVTTLTPIDFGPDTMTWPSETARTAAPRPTLEWPSLAWTDDPFGTRDTTLKAEAASREVDRRANAARAAISRGESPRALAQPKRAKPAPKAKAKLAASTSPDVPAVATFFEDVPAQPQLPSPAQLQQLLETKGLAGTVRHLMQQTGWDLDTVAKFIAENRR